MLHQRFGVDDRVVDRRNLVNRRGAGRPDAVFNVDGQVDLGVFLRFAAGIHEVTHDIRRNLQQGAEINRYQVHRAVAGQAHVERLVGFELGRAVVERQDRRLGHKAGAAVLDQGKKAGAKRPDIVDHGGRIRVLQQSLSLVVLDVDAQVGVEIAVDVQDRGGDFYLPLGRVYFLQQLAVPGNARQQVAHDNAAHLRIHRDKMNDATGLRGRRRPGSGFRGAGLGRGRGGARRRSHRLDGFDVLAAQALTEKAAENPAACRCRIFFAVRRPGCPGARRRQVGKQVDTRDPHGLGQDIGQVDQLLLVVGVPDFQHAHHGAVAVAADSVLHGGFIAADEVDDFPDKADIFGQSAQAHDAPVKDNIPAVEVAADGKALVGCDEGGGVEGRRVQRYFLPGNLVNVAHEQRGAVKEPRQVVGPAEQVDELQAAEAGEFAADALPLRLLAEHNRDRQVAGEVQQQVLQGDFPGVETEGLALPLRIVRGRQRIADGEQQQPRQEGEKQVVPGPAPHHPVATFLFGFRVAGTACQRFNFWW